MNPFAHPFVAMIVFAMGGFLIGLLYVRIATRRCVKCRSKLPTDELCADCRESIPKSVESTKRAMVARMGK